MLKLVLSIDPKPWWHSAWFCIIPQATKMPTQSALAVHDLYSCQAEVTCMALCWFGHRSPCLHVYLLHASFEHSWEGYEVITYTEEILDQTLAHTLHPTGCGTCRSTAAEALLESPP